MSLKSPLISTPHRLWLATGTLLLAALTVLPIDLAAQDRSWPPQYRRSRPELAIEASGSVSTLTGNAVGAASEGTGFDVMGSVGVSVLSLGGGYSRSTHSLGGTNAVLQGIFFEPRVALPFAARNFTPFLFGRVTRLDRSLANASASSSETSAKGTGLGAGVGTYVWLAPNVQLNTSVGWTDMRFSTAEASSAFPAGARTAGSSWGVRAGLTLGFDSWGR